MQPADTGQRRYQGDVERLRSPERVARFEIDRVVDLSLSGAAFNTLLDIGTGSGLFAQAFAARGLRVTGVDLRPDMLHAARHEVPGATFCLSHMQNLPFSNHSFDLVFMGMVLHEADSLIPALQEAYRVGRRVVILEWPYQPAAVGPPLEHRLPPEQLVGAAAGVGLQVLTQLEFNHLSFYCLEHPA